MHISAIFPGVDSGKLKTMKLLMLDFVPVQSETGCISFARYDLEVKMAAGGVVHEILIMPIFSVDKLSTCMFFHLSLFLYRCVEASGNIRSSYCVISGSNVE